MRIFIHLNQFIVFSKSFLTMIISYKQTDKINLQNRITYIPSFPDLRTKHVKKKMRIDQGYICIKLSISNRSRVDNIFLIIGPSPKSESEGRTNIYNHSVAYPSHIFKEIFTWFGLRFRLSSGRDWWRRAAGILTTVDLLPPLDAFLAARLMMAFIFCSTEEI